MFIKVSTTTKNTIEIRHVGIMQLTNHRIPKQRQTIIIPDIAENVPIPVQLFKGTPYSNNARPKQPITPPGHTNMAPTKLYTNKRHKANPPNIANKKSPKKLMEEFAKTLQKSLTKELENNNGKPHKDKSFTADVVLRHIVPHVLNCFKKSKEVVHSNFFEQLRWNPVLPTILVEPTFTTTNLMSLQAVTGIVGKYLRLYKQYAHTNTSRARGYITFHQFQTETEFNQERIDLYSAALFQQGFSIEKTI